MVTDLYTKIKNRDEFISLIGLGYVGMPIAVEFARRGSTYSQESILQMKLETM